MQDHNDITNILIKIQHDYNSFDRNLDHVLKLLSENNSAIRAKQLLEAVISDFLKSKDFVNEMVKKNLSLK